jgi:hypothetical protein
LKADGGADGQHHEVPEHGIAFYGLGFKHAEGPDMRGYKRSSVRCSSSKINILSSNFIKI